MKGVFHTFTFPVHIPFTLICMGSSSAALVAGLAAGLALGGKVHCRNY